MRPTLNLGEFPDLSQSEDEISFDEAMRKLQKDPQEVDKFAEKAEKKPSAWMLRTPVLVLKVSQNWEDIQAEMDIFKETINNMEVVALFEGTPGLEKYAEIAEKVETPQENCTNCCDCAQDFETALSIQLELRKILGAVPSETLVEMAERVARENKEKSEEISKLHALISAMEAQLSAVSKVAPVTDVTTKFELTNGEMEKLIAEVYKSVARGVSIERSSVFERNLILAGLEAGLDCCKELAKR